MPPNPWIHDYILLALRLNRCLEAGPAGSLLDYFGPPAWQEQVNQEAPWDPARLLEEVERLQASLSDPHFEPSRARFLAATLRALGMVCRRLRGDMLSLQEEAAAYFDLPVDWLPEAVFETAYDLYDHGLPGRGEIAPRLQRWQSSLTLPPERADQLTGFLEKALVHIRRWARAALPLPEDEEVEIAPVYDQPVRGLAAYLGNHRSKILLNPAVPFPLGDLFYVLCHEGYPGHLAEILLKEEALVNQRGFLEQQVQFLLTPPYVLSEGMALLAHEMLFVPGEEQAWLAEHVFSPAGITPEPFDLTAILRARDLLRGVSCNAAFLLREGRPHAEVLAYLMRYGRMDEARARSELATLQRPFFDAYIFTYHHGRRLLEPVLSGEQRQAALLRLLTTQALPSEIG